MGIKIKSKGELLGEILQDISIDSSTGIALYENSSAYDFVILPLLDQVKDSYILADFISRSRSLTELEDVVRDANYQDALRFALNLTFPDVQALISTTIDNLASTWNESRKQPDFSRGYIALYFTSAGAVTLDAGLTVGTQSGIKFDTLNSFNGLTPVFDQVQGLYYVESAIKAQIAGSSSNVEAGNINVLYGNAQNLVSVVNKTRTMFGVELENDLQFIQRLQTIWQSKRTNVLPGFINSLINYPGVQDVSVIMPGDPLQVRNDKNAVDVYLIAEEKIQLQDDIFNSVSARYAWERIDDELSYEIYPTPYTAGEAPFKLSSQPILGVSAVSYASSVNGSFSDIDNYAINQDTTGVFAYSVRGFDHIVIAPAAIPNNVWVKVSYTYDRLYKDLQALYKKYDTAIIGADILFKKATQRSVLVTVEIVLTSEFQPFLATVQNTIISDFVIFFNGGVDSNNVTRDLYRLGDKLDKSDLVNLITSVQGVDRINLNTFSVKIDGVEMNQTFTPGLTEYLRSDTVTFLASSTKSNIQPITNR